MMLTLFIGNPAGSEYLMHLLEEHKHSFNILTLK